MTNGEPTPLPVRRRRKPTTRRRTTRRPAARGGITATLRSQLAEHVKPCPTCGSAGGNKSAMSREMGISIMSLNKFLKGGRVNSDTIDAVHTFLNKPKD